MKLFNRRNKKEISQNSKVVIDLINLLEKCPIENPTNAELALYLAQNCKVVVV